MELCDIILEGFADGRTEVARLARVGQSADCRVQGEVS